MFSMCRPELDLSSEDDDLSGLVHISHACPSKKLRTQLPTLILEYDPPRHGPNTERTPSNGSRGKRFVGFASPLWTPSACSTGSPQSRTACTLPPSTPEASRESFRSLRADVAVGVVIFDFDGTLTSTPGEFAHRRGKHEELRDRAAMLRPWLRSLRDGGITLGIMSKSTEHTIRGALKEADLCDLFEDGPLMGRAIGFEGKAGFIEDMVNNKGLSDGVQSREDALGITGVLLVDDDICELERAKSKGIQTYPAPKVGGLQQQDFQQLSKLLSHCNRKLVN